MSGNPLAVFIRLYDMIISPGLFAVLFYIFLNEHQIVPEKSYSCIGTTWKRKNNKQNGLRVENKGRKGGLANSGGWEMGGTSDNAKDVQHRREFSLRSLQIWKWCTRNR
jgi:hypothetical protein